MRVFALSLADKPSRFKYMERNRRKLGKEQWLMPVGRLRGKSSMQKKQKSTGSAGLSRRKDGGVPLGCPFGCSLQDLCYEGIWARLGPAGAEQRQPLAPHLVSGVPGAGGSHQEVWEGCSGCGGSLSSCAHCPWHSRCMLTMCSPSPFPGESCFGPRFAGVAAVSPHSLPSLGCLGAQVAEARAIMGFLSTGSSMLHPKVFGRRTWASGTCLLFSCRGCEQCFSQALAAHVALHRAWRWMWPGCLRVSSLAVLCPWLAGESR